jgi:hypothetical protein
MNTCYLVFKQNLYIFIYKEYIHIILMVYLLKKILQKYMAPSGLFIEYQLKDLLVPFLSNTKKETKRRKKKEKIYISNVKMGTN